MIRAELILAQVAIAPGIYRHHKGGLYQVDGFEEGSDGVLVCYHDVVTGERYQRPLAEWKQLVRPEGKSYLVPRYSLLMVPDAEDK